MRPYSRDLRQRVLNACLEGDSSQRAIARRFDVSRAFVSRVLQRYKETGEISAKDRSGGRRRKIGPHERQALRHILDERPEATLDELCSHFRRQTGIEVSVPTMHRAVKELEETVG